MTVVVSRYKQNPESPLCGHKTTSYFDRLLALKEEAGSEGERGGFGLRAHTNYLAEGSISNVVIVDKEGTLATPPLMLPEQAGRRLLFAGDYAARWCWSWRTGDESSAA